MNEREELQILLEQVEDETLSLEELHYPKNIPISLEERWLNWVETVDN